MVNPSSKIMFLIFQRQRVSVHNPKKRHLLYLANRLWKDQFFVCFLPLRIITIITKKHIPQNRRSKNNFHIISGDADSHFLQYVSSMFALTVSLAIMLNCFDLLFLAHLSHTHISHYHPFFLFNDSNLTRWQRVVNKLSGYLKVFCRC